MILTAKELYDLASEIIHQRGEMAKISIYMVDKSDFLSYFDYSDVTDDFFNTVLNEVDDAISDEADLTLSYIFNKYIDHNDEGDE